MQVRAMEKIKKHCTLLPYLFLREPERCCGSPKYNVGGRGPRGSPRFLRHCTSLLDSEFTEAIEYIRPKRTKETESCGI